MKAYNINMAGRHGLNLEDGRGTVSGVKNGFLRGLRKYFTAEDPYCLRRRLLRTVLKRIAVIAILALPIAGMTHPLGPHHRADNNLSAPAPCPLPAGH